MERKLPMTKQEIISDYKAAKAPQKQIGVLADLNLCSKKEIAGILLEAGCEVPKYYDRKPKPEMTKADPAPALDQSEAVVKDMQLSLKPMENKSTSIRHAAIDAIANLLVQADEGGGTGFRENVRGVLALVWAMERTEGDDD